MPRFFAKEAGARVMVQGFGEATATNAVEVPESVAAELAKHPGLVAEVATLSAAEGREHAEITFPNDPTIPPDVVTIGAPKRNKPAKGEKE